MTLNLSLPIDRVWANLLHIPFIMFKWKSSLIHETLQSVSAGLNSTLESCRSRLPLANECLSSRTRDYTNESEDEPAKSKSFLLPWRFTEVATRR